MTAAAHVAIRSIYGCYQVINDTGRKTTKGYRILDVQCIVCGQHATLSATTVLAHSHQHHCNPADSARQREQADRQATAGIDWAHELQAQADWIHAHRQATHPMQQEKTCP